MAGKAAKALSGLGDEAAEALGKYWGKKGVAEMAEHQAKLVEDLAREQTSKILSKMDKGLRSGVGGNISSKLRDSFITAKSQLNKELDRMRQFLDDVPKDLSNQIDDLAKKQEAIKRIPMDVPNRQQQVQGILGGTMETETTIANRLKELRSLMSSKMQTEAKMVYMKEARDEIAKGNYKYVADKLFGTGKEQEMMTGMLGSNLAAEIQGLSEQIVRSNAFASPFLNQPKKFLEQYLNYELRSPDLAKEFMSNPQNMALLGKIKNRHPELVEELIKKQLTKAPFRKRLTGLTWDQLGRNLGISAAVVGIPATYAGVKVYSWLNNNDPEGIATHGRGMSSAVGSIRPTGPAISIVGQVKSSLDSVSEVSNNADEQLKDPAKAPEAAKAYITAISTEGARIANALQQWDVVINNCENPDNAKSVQDALTRYVQMLSSGLKSLGAEALDIPSAPSSEMSVVSNDNIKKVQDFFDLNQTGKMDAATISALQGAERDFNARAGTDMFTGLFVDPRKGYVISYENLMTAYNKIQKY